MEYATPQLRSLGSLTSLTLGHGGSSCDGTGLTNQLGGGNDYNYDSVTGKCVPTS